MTHRPDEELGAYRSSEEGVEEDAPLNLSSGKVEEDRGSLRVLGRELLQNPDKIQVKINTQDITLENFLKIAPYRTMSIMTG